MAWLSSRDNPLRNQSCAAVNCTRGWVTLRGQAFQHFPRSSNGRTAAFGAVNRGSNPCRGAKFLNPALSQLSCFLFYDFLGSNGAEFQMLRTALYATRRPVRLTFRLLPVPNAAVPRRAVARIIR